MPPEKYSAKTVFSLIGNEIVSRPEQREKAQPPMFVTESGIVMLVRPEQPEKADSPMLVTESGIVMLVSPEQPEKA